MIVKLPQAAERKARGRRLGEGALLNSLIMLAIRVFDEPRIKVNREHHQHEREPERTGDRPVLEAHVIPGKTRLKLPTLRQILWRHRFGR